MPQPQLTLRLSGKPSQGEAVSFADFREFCGGLASCLHKVEDVVAPQSRPSYLISDMSNGSCRMTITPVPRKKGQDRGAEVLALFVDTIVRLEDGRGVDPRFSKEDLRVFRRLAEPLNKGLAGLEIGGKRITTRFIANIDSMIGPSIPSEGSVTGRLERLNFHNRTEFALYPPIEGFVVACDFPEEMTEKVISAINHTVTVSGRMTFRPDSPFPERVQVRSIEVHPPDNALPQLGDLRGLLRGGLGGKPPVEFLKSIRDEQEA